MDSHVEFHIPNRNFYLPAFVGLPRPFYCRVFNMRLYLWGSVCVCLCVCVCVCAMLKIKGEHPSMEKESLQERIT